MKIAVRDRAPIFQEEQNAGDERKAEKK